MVLLNHSFNTISIKAFRDIIKKTSIGCFYSRVIAKCQYSSKHLVVDLSEKTILFVYDAVISIVSTEIHDQAPDLHPCPLRLVWCFCREVLHDAFLVLSIYGFIVVKESVVSIISPVTHDGSLLPFWHAIQSSLKLVTLLCWIWLYVSVHSFLCSWKAEIGER